jgi:hypothetical protein
MWMVRTCLGVAECLEQRVAPQHTIHHLWPQKGHILLIISWGRIAPIVQRLQSIVFFTPLDGTPNLYNHTRE